MSEKVVLEKLEEILAAVKGLAMSNDSGNATAKTNVYVPVANTSLPPPVEVSPEELRDAAGWFEQQGLKLSLMRSFGCHLIANRFLTGLEFKAKAAEIAKQYKASERLIRMLGNDLLRNWYMLPTVDISASGYPGFRVPYEPIKPEVPYNDEEIRLFVENYPFSHLSQKSLLTGTLQAAEMYFSAHLEVPNVSKRSVGALIKDHFIYTTPNYPQNIIKEVVAWYSNDAWLAFEYRKMLAAAHAIDKGERRAEDYPGYAHPKTQGGEISQAWWNEFEDGAPNATPELVALK